MSNQNVPPSDGDRSEGKDVKPNVKHVLSFNTDSLKPSIENDDIYGKIDPRNPEFVNLVISIQANGIGSPIVVSRDLHIISGHRRHAAAKLLGLKEVSCHRRE